MTQARQPKYQDVQDYIQASIRDGQLRPGQRAPSENELSRQFGISRLTARHALSRLAAAGILQQMQGSGTYVRERQHRIGVCMTYVDSYIFPDILSGIAGILRQNQMTLVLTCSNNELSQEEMVLGNLLEQNLDGLIWEPARSALRSSGDRLLEQVRRSRLPTVLINSPLPFPEAGMVLTADAAGMDLLAEHLLALGHRQAAGLFCRDLAQGSRRREGLLAAMTRLGLTIHPDHLLWFDSRDLIQGFDSLVSPWLECLLAGRVTALCCYNDQIARRCDLLLRQIGCRIPEDISLTGFDAVERIEPQSPDFGPYTVSPAFPARLAGLTTVTHPCAELGRRAAEMLLALLDSGQPPASLLLEMTTELIPGSSSGPARIFATQA